MTQTSERAYLNGLQHILDNGRDVGQERTGIGRRKVLAYQMRFPMSEGFPLMTTKKVPFKNIVTELLWFLSGDTNIRNLVLNNNPIWNEWPFQKWLKTNGLEAQFPKYTDEWQDQKSEFIDKIRNDEAFAKKWGELGPVYGHQWINYGATKNEDGSYNKDGINQIARAIDLIKNKPSDTRIIVDAWNPEENDLVDLPPCHTIFFMTVIDGHLSLHMVMRSADAFLGVPFNIASYALLLQMLAQVTGTIADELIVTCHDFHLYFNQFEQAREQLQNEPFPLPTIKLNPEIKNIFDFKLEDIELVNYESHKAIKAQVAV